jgi:hypothetical protein
MNEMFKPIVESLELLRITQAPLSLGTASKKNLGMVCLEIRSRGRSVLVDLPEGFR